MSIQDSNAFSIKTYKMTVGVETVELKSYSNVMAKKGTVQRMGGNTYRVIGSDEIKTYKAEATEEERNAALNRKLSALRNLIRANLRSQKDLFVSLTYSANQTNCEKMQEDVERCIRRLRRKHDFRYIAVPELQANGRWHIHVLLMGDELYIPQYEIEKAWGCGIVHVSRVRNAENVAVYLSANSKKKQLRRKDYPKHMRLYRCSSNINRPIVKIVCGNEVGKEIEGCTLVYHKAYQNSDGYWYSITVYTKRDT